MNHYFPYEESIQYRQGSNVRKVLETIANQYIGSAPPHGFTFRTVSGDSFRQHEDGRYDLELNGRFPERRLGEYGYACSLVHSEQGGATELSLSCYGPTRIYLNGELFYKSTMDDDVNINNRRLLQAQLRPGWNLLFVKMVKTSSGFGCILGSSNYKWFPLHCLSPFAERSGSGGWVYSSSETDLYPEEALPSIRSEEASLPTRWLPGLTQDGGQTCDLKQLYGVTPGQTAYAWSSFATGGIGEATHVLTGEASASLRIWVDRVPVLDTGKGMFQTTTKLTPGEHTVLIQTVCGETDWSVSLSVSREDGRDCPLRAPQEVKGVNSAWICLGPFRHSGLESPDIASIDNLYRLFRQTDDSNSEQLYWRSFGLVNGYVRPYLEDERYARWNYPLGVTLYGLLQTGRVIDRPDLIRYVIGHISECVSLYPYSLWDRDRYGAAAVNHQLVELNMLDDCGSFGSAMLEAYEEADDERFLDIAPIVADYILHRQERREDGAFYRIREGEYQENTLWADDLYMSTPFLIRYYKQTGEEAAIDDAARQFLLFKRYLYMPDQRIMSHVYDFKYNTPTYVPWGRGNGWVLFSLSELLAVLPESHSDRDALLSFFNELASGYLALQGENGLWHQVLTDPTSYEEASCTAMFAYAFCRGVRFGWLADAARYADAAGKAWEGLTRLAIDQSGNVYGVCRGSGYSFTAEYYRDELNWVLNDTHGIGIVLLCGAEYERMLGML